MKKASVKEWFENKLAKEMGLPRLYFLTLYCGIKETDKAVYALFYTGYDRTGMRPMHRAHWIPKSCIDNLENLRFIDNYDNAVTDFEDNIESFLCRF
jgi:hypothetical protein